jgi:hypothetical protein
LGVEMIKNQDMEKLNYFRVHATKEQFIQIFGKGVDNGSYWWAVFSAHAHNVVLLYAILPKNKRKLLLDAINKQKPEKKN